ncbi:hypothetical protein COOONC_08390 [Cooperia oncophora]
MADTLIAGERNHSRNELDMEVFSSNVLFYCGLYFALGMALLAIGYISNASLYTMCERRVHSIRAKYLRAVMRQDMTWFDQQQTGALTMKMSSWRMALVMLITVPLLLGATQVSGKKDRRRRREDLKDFGI